MILTVTPNPALDKTAVIPGFHIGETYRTEVLTLAGGKGLNVARALSTLNPNLRCLAIAPLGGYTGQYLRDLARREGLDCTGPVLVAELRTCLTIVDPLDGSRVTEVYEQSAGMTAGDWERVLRVVDEHCAQATCLAVCGSLPAGMPENGLAQLVKRAHAARIPTLLDVSSPQVLQTLPLRPALLKINQFEAGSMLGQNITTPGAAMAAARTLQELGACSVVITLGRVGAVGISEQGETFAWTAPQVNALSPIGSGDCLLAGIISGQAQGEALTTATRLGIAAGAANTLQIGAGRLERQQVEELLPQVHHLSHEKGTTGGLG